MLAASALSGCKLERFTNPTPGARASRVGDVWVRHLKDKHDREAVAQVGFTLTDSKSKPIAADGDMAVELKWRTGMMEWIAKGEAEVSARSFREAADKPVRDGSWYVEPWNIYLIGARYPGPSKHGYDLSLTFTTEDGRKLNWRRWVTPER